VQAQKYVMALRKLIGNRYPVGLAGLPYVDYHPAFPYSIFLGPGGAQFNLPQMYWKDIGTTVDAVYAHTYEYNGIYGRPIFPLGQTYSSPRASDITRFRQLSIAYGAAGLSWWDWQETPAKEFATMSQPIAALTAFIPATTVATIRRGAKGDLVVWAQEHLITAGDKVTVDGSFGPRTQKAVLAFQTARGLAPNGVIGPATWVALLRYQPAFVHWWLHVPKPAPKRTTKPKTTAKKARAAADAAAAVPSLNAGVPLSARLRSRSELRGAPGRGR
jgi:hypothetical protein